MVRGDHVAGGSVLMRSWLHYLCLSAQKLKTPAKVADRLGNDLAIVQRGKPLNDLSRALVVGAY
jgi:hypothetical protein